LAKDWLIQISRKKQSDFFEASKNNPEVKTERERLAILKNMAGTFAMALLVVLATLLLRPSQGQYLPVEIILAITVFFLISENWHHAEEQRLWEEIHLQKPTPKKNRRR
jgi:hypothetical protein